MQRSRKRQRTVPVVVQSATRRPIDKQLVNVKIAAQSNIQTNIILITATYPGTITGIRWSLAFNNIIGGNSNYGTWMIVRSRDGLTPSTIGFTSAASAYTPEQEVIAYGKWNVQDTDIATNNGPSVQIVEGTTKSMRKLMGGDRIYFVCNGEVAGSTIVTGVIQFFSKT